MYDAKDLSICTCKTLDEDGTWQVNYWEIYHSANGESIVDAQWHLGQYVDMLDFDREITRCVLEEMDLPEIVISQAIRMALVQP